MADEKKYSLEKFDSVVEYTTFLNDFEGPLDFLLFLINKQQIDIKDVFVSSVTEQFLSYMQGLEYLEISKACEYLAIASKIIEIKARSLVPSDVEDEEEEIDPKDEFINTLEEYKLFKEESKKLKDLETIGYVYKEPDKSVGQIKVVYKDFTLDGLLNAFTSLMLRQTEINKAKDQFKAIPKDEFTVVDKSKFIQLTLQNVEHVYFDELFVRDSTKVEIITTFQALLLLLKYQAIIVEQDTVFGQILIKRNPESQVDFDSLENIEAEDGAK